MIELKINPEYQALIPPLSDDEYKNLEQSILEEGVRDALIISNDTLIDGHNRYEICKKHNIGFDTVNKTFDNDTDIKLWIINNQLSRRNISTFTKIELILKSDEFKKNKELGKQRILAGDPLPTVGKRIDVSQDIANKLKICRTTATKAMEVEKEATPEQKELLKKGEVSIHSVFNDIQRNNIYNNLNKNNKTLSTDNKYKIIYADPPWQYGDKGVDNYGHTECHYPTLSINELCNLPIRDITEENAVLFIWVTSPFLENSFKVINSWGFKYKTSFVWDKIKHNFGHYNSVRHEFLLIATKGLCIPDIKELHDSVVSIRRSDKHSEKPSYFRELIEKLYIGKKIELFSRSEHDGWDVWGNESA